MPRLSGALILLAFVISVPLTALIRGLSNRLKAHDTPPVAGQVKFAGRRVPNTGGVAIFLALLGPILAGILLAQQVDASGREVPSTWPAWAPPELYEHMGGIQSQAPLAILLVGALATLHVLGLIDDRRPLGPWLKLTVMTLPALAV